MVPTIPSTSATTSAVIGGDLALVRAEGGAEALGGAGVVGGDDRLVGGRRVAACPAWAESPARRHPEAGGGSGGAAARSSCEAVHKRRLRGPRQASGSRDGGATCARHPIYAKTRDGVAGKKSWRARPGERRAPRSLRTSRLATRLPISAGRGSRSGDTIVRDDVRPPTE